MNITRAAVSLNVSDVQRSVDFAATHFGFEVEMATEGFASLARDGVGFNLIFLRVGLETFKPQRVAGPAGDGLLVVFVVDGINAEYERLVSASAPVVTTIQTEPWGERYFQVEDPNGIIYQIVQWLDPQPNDVP